MLQLPKACHDALTQWIKPKSWNTTHPYDMGRFYHFVKSIRDNFHKVPNEVELQEQIFDMVKEFHPEFVHQTAKDVIRQRISLAIDIIDYLEHAEGRCTC